MNCIRASEFEISGLGAAVPGAPPPGYYYAPPVGYYSMPVPQAPPTPYYPPAPPLGPVAHNVGGKWKWDGGKSGEYDAYGRLYGSHVVPEESSPGTGSSSGPVAHNVGGKWKWDGGKSGEVDVNGRLYGSPVVDEAAQAAAAAAIARPASGVSLEDVMLWAAAGAAGIGIAWVIAKRRKK